MAVRIQATLPQGTPPHASPLPVGTLPVREAAAEQVRSDAVRVDGGEGRALADRLARMTAPDVTSLADDPRPIRTRVASAVRPSLRRVK